VLSVSLSGNTPPAANETLVAKPVTERPPSILRAAAAATAATVDL